MCQLVELKDSLSQKKKEKEKEKKTLRNFTTNFITA